MKYRDVIVVQGLSLIAFKTAILTEAFVNVVTIVDRFQSFHHSSNEKLNGLTPTTTNSLLPLQAKKDATFGMGCFWKPSEELLKVDGVLDTAAGYTGDPSAEAPPNYDSVCFSKGEWVEGVRVEYDDEKISYQQLLDAFFEAQEPKINSRQYASIIFPHDEDQKQAAQAWLEEGVKSNRVRELDGLPVSFTSVEPLSRFYKAEGYHQRYWQKFRPRLAAVVGLIALNSIPLDTYVTPDIESTIQSGVDWSLKIIAATVILERIFDTKVEEI